MTSAAIITQDFLDQVNVQGDGCWVWLGAYGGPNRAYPLYQRRQAAHVVLAMVGRAVPAGTRTERTCARAACVNPDHVVVEGTGEPARFWSRVDRSGGQDACWPWTGPLHARGGYGKHTCGNRTTLAHRRAFELTNGPLGRLQANHRCDNRRCCNPAHLYAGTQADNMRDRVERGRWSKGRPMEDPVP